VRDCIGEIAKREGRPGLAPQYREWLSQWESRSDLPADYRWLKEQLKTTFGQRLERLREEKRIQEKARERELDAQRAATCEAIYSRNKDLIEKFLEIAERKVSIIDEYGDENWDVLDKELDACMTKITKRDGVSVDWREPEIMWGTHNLAHAYSRLRQKLNSEFREFHTRQKRVAGDVDVSALGGVDFETYVARRLKECGYDDVRGTSATGDQGADLIAKKNGRTIIIQAKRYQGTVGNKAVQEVASAVSFYGGDEGWVITNSTFTPSARALAQKTNVRLFEGRDLERLSEILRS
jgi:Restriction endonuclease